MFTIGCDPEVFVKRNGKPVSAYGLVQGTKESPQPVEHGAVQVDGMALEINTAPVPVQDFALFNRNIVAVVRQLKGMLPKDMNLSFVPTQEFGKALMEEQPDEAKELGCDPDYCAYTMKANPRPDGDRTFRTAAGHIHIGWGSDIPVDNEEHHAICASFVKALDATVGLFMCYIDRDPLRRELYGKAGAYRAKPYGVEYRTPSNVWLINKDRRLIVHTLVNTAIQWMRSGRELTVYTRGVQEEEIQRIINEGDWQAAERLLNMFLSSPAWFKIKESFLPVVTKDDGQQAA